MSFFYEHLYEALIVLGIVALIIEVAVLGLSSFVLFFLGLSLISSGLMMMAGILPETGMVAMWSNVIITSLLSVVLWKPLRKLQNDRKQPDNIASDFAQDLFVLEQDVHLDGSASRRYSGIEWKLKSHQPLSAGTTVRVVKTEVGVMWVEAAG